MAKKSKKSTQKILSKRDNPRQLRSEIEGEFLLLQAIINKHFEDTTNKIQGMINKKTNN